MKPIIIHSEEGRHVWIFGEGNILLASQHLILSLPTFTLTWIQPPAEPLNVKYNICSSYYMTYPDTKLYIENKTENMNALFLRVFK